MDENANKEIENALKEFEQKSALEVSKTPAVAETSFAEPPSVVKLAMKATGGQDQRKAEYVILGVVAVMILISIYLFFFTGKVKTPSPPGGTLGATDINIYA